MPQHHRTRPCLWRATPCIARTTLTLALGALLGACGDTPPEHDLDTWPLRDALGVAPSWALDLSPERRDALRDRLSDRAVAQAEASDWVELPAPVPDDGDVRASVVRLDDALLGADRAPLLIQWAARDDDGSLGAWACPLTAADLATPLNPDEDSAEAAPRWELDTRFNQPLDPSRPDGLTEAALLDAHLPRLARWLTRCDTAAGHTPNPDTHSAEPVRIARAPGAPALASWWPQTRTLALNPLALALWPTPAPPEPVALQRRPQALDTQTYEDCVDATALLCRTCIDTPEAVSEATCDADLLPNADSPARETCLTVLADVQGPEFVCLNRLLYDRSDSLYACVVTRAPECAIGPPPDDVHGLNDTYVTFFNDDACMNALYACLGDPEPSSPPPSRPFVNDEPTPTYTSNDPSCFSDGCDTLLCLASSSDTDGSGGDPICDDTDGEACGDSCEGDSVDSGGGESCGDACSGCEGDTL